MVILSIVGKADTRVIAYTMARAISLDGQAVILSDDGAYKRLYHGSENEGTVSGVDIVVSSNICDADVERLVNSNKSYDNIIIVSSDFLYKKSDSVLVCKGIDGSMDGDGDDASEDGIEELVIPEEMKQETLVISFDKPTEKGIVSLQLKDGAIRYVYRCEERKSLQYQDDKTISKLVVNYMDKLLGIEKDKAIKLLKRKEYIKSAKKRG